jgi:hypothetical protein
MSMKAKIRVMFRGELRTIYEIERLTGIPHYTLRRRARHGQPLDGPGLEGNRVRELGELDPHLPYEEDEECQRLIAENPNGLGQAEIARLFNCSRERIRQLEEQAMAKLLMGRARKHVLHAIEAADVLEKMRKPGMMDSAPDTVVSYRPSDKKAG